MNLPAPTRSPQAASGSSVNQPGNLGAVEAAPPRFCVFRKMEGSHHESHNRPSYQL
jgi:hypothetical protein